MKILGTVKEIYLYPVKSLAGIQLDKCVITKLGVAHPENPEVIDRKWMVVDEKGSFLTQRQIPKMVLIKPSVANDHLVLSAPGRKDLIVPIKPTKNRKKCRVWNLPIDGYSYGGEVSKWLSEFLERENLDLVCFGNDLEPRKVAEVNEQSNKARDSDVVIYEDYSPFMLISEGSLNELNSRLAKPVQIRNFRPNFFAKDCEAFAEDNWTHFRIGDSKFFKIKHCSRCLLTTVDPLHGIKDPNQEPIRTLKEYRSNKELYGVSPMMGINFASDEEGFQVLVGDLIVADQY